MSKLTRRAFLGLGGAVGITGLAYGSGLVACQVIDRSTPDFFASLPGMDSETVRQVGRQVVKANTHLASRQTTSRMLAAKPNLEKAVTTTCADTRLALVQEQCRQDFADDRIVLVDGWMISETEAVLSAHSINA